MGNTFKTGNYVNAIFQDTSNNIGIGAAPSGTYKFDVTGTGRFTSDLTSLTIKSTYTGGSNWNSFGNELFIGTNGANNNYFSDNMYYNGGWLLSKAGAGAQIYFGASAAGSIDFRTAPTGAAGGTPTITNRMTILQGGNVGIGTQNPVSPLHVETGGSGETTLLRLQSPLVSGNHVNLVFGSITGGTSFDVAKIQMVNGGASNFGLAFYTYSSGLAQRMAINKDGIITFNAYGAGTLSTSSAGVISASDGRFKTKTRNVDNGLDAILKLKPTYYRWNEDSPFASEYEELGFIAQEVGSIIPEASPEPETDKFKNYHDRAIIAMLTKAIQEQQATITSLQDRLTKGGL